MQKNTLALFVPNCNTGGTERVCQRIANYLTDIGHSVLVISMAANPFPYPIQCAYYTLDVNLPAVRLARWFHRRRRLKEILDNHSVSAILSMGEYPNVLVASLPARFRRVNRYTNSSVSLVGLQGWVMRLALRWAFTKSDATIVPVMRLAAELGLPNHSKKITEMPNPLDLAEIRQQSLQQPQTLSAQHWMLVKSGQYFLHVGQLVEQKDHLTLLKTFARYRAEDGQLQLVLLGQGHLEQEILSWIDKMQLSNAVIFLGWVENPLFFMAQARALIMTSKWEGTPNAMIEAMALGCPIISTDCPTGPREILLAGQSGRLVPLDDSDALVAELKRIDRDDTWRAQWSIAASERADFYSILRVGPLLNRVMNGSKI